MLLQLAVALSLTQIQDTCTIDSNSVYTRSCHVACAGNFNTWDDVIDFRHIANKEGFGSTAILLLDSTYELSFVLFGDSSTVYTQWLRLNDLLGISLSLRKPTIGEVRPEETVMITALPARMPIDKLNVSVWDRHTLIIETSLLEIGEDFGPFINEDTVQFAALLLDTANYVPENETFLMDEETLITVDSQLDYVEFKPEFQDSVFTEGLTTDLDSSGINGRMTIKEDRLSVSIVDVEPIVSKSISNEVIVEDYTEESVLSTESSLEEQIFDLVSGELIREKDPITNYLIVFGSYEDRQLALKRRNELQSEGILAVIKPHKSYFRVGVYYDYYPSKELTKFKKSHAPCWVATIPIK